MSMERIAGNKVRAWATVLFVAAGLVSGAANAAILVAEPDGVVLDTRTGLEWEQAPSSSTFNWADAVSHAAGVATDGGGFHLATQSELVDLYQDLRADGVCAGANCTGNIGGFTGIQNLYWSGTEKNPGLDALFFGFFDIARLGDDREGSLFAAWAVRPGDVDGAAAPEPASLLLIGAGMLGLGWSGRRGRRR
jgi:hypothetical protein